MKYTLIAEDEYSGAKTTREFTNDYLPNVLTELELFLKGAGFDFNGNLDFVDAFADSDTDFEIEPDWDDCYTTDDSMGNLPNNNWPFAGAGSTIETGEVENAHSHQYFDTERNK